MATVQPTFACAMSPRWSSSRRPTSMATRTTCWAAGASRPWCRSSPAFLYADVSVSGFNSVSVTPQQFSGCAPIAPATTCTETLAGTGVNGDGSSANRLPFIERNSYNYPKTAVFDLRVGKNFYFESRIPHFDRVRFEVFAELFNVMNHQNITGLTTEAYTLTSSAECLH